MPCFGEDSSCTRFSGSGPRSAIGSAPRIPAGRPSVYGSWDCWILFFCFILVVVRHLRFFMDPVPGCVTSLQPFGLAAGYVLPVATAYIAALRICGMRESYVSYRNYVVLGLVFAISAVGLVMRNFFVPDLVDVKEFGLGILRFGPSAVPGGYVFLAHFSLVLLLIPYLPVHLFTAPCVTMEARRREAALTMVMHER